MGESGTSTVRRGLTWVLCLAAIVLGSLAWSAWVFLNTWADPSTTERVTAAVLADPDARDEVLEPVRAQVRSMVPVETGVTDAQIDGALDAVLADPAARVSVADAFVGSGGLLQIGAAGDAFGAELARRQPGLAPFVEASPLRLALPDLSTTERARDLARSSVWWLALGSASLFAASFVVGDRRRTARRLGVWAISVGGLWVIGLPTAGWLAQRFVTRLDATVDVVIREYARPIVPVAIVLVVIGAAALVASFIPVHSSPQLGRPASQSQHATRRQASANAPVRRAAGMQTPVAPARSVRRRMDTQEMPVQHRPRPTGVAAGSGHGEQWPAGPTVPMATVGPVEQTEASVLPDDDTGEIDVWAAYGPS